MHVATMVLLIAIAALGLTLSFVAPTRVGNRPKTVEVGDGLRVMMVMAVIILCLAVFYADSGGALVRGLTLGLIASRTAAMTRYAGLIGKRRPVNTWARMSVLIFWTLAEVALAVLVLVFAW